MTTPATVGLPVFPHHFYSVQVSEMGEDTDFVGHGHITPMRFIAACNRAARLNWGARSLIDSGDGSGTSVIDSNYTELRSSVQHAWAVRRPDPEAWSISWDGITADTPGAFPVTLGIWSW